MNEKPPGPIVGRMVERDGMTHAVFGLAEIEAWIDRLPTDEDRKEDAAAQCEGEDTCSGTCMELPGCQRLRAGGYTDDDAGREAMYFDDLDRRRREEDQ